MKKKATYIVLEAIRLDATIHMFGDLLICVRGLDRDVVNKYGTELAVDNHEKVETDECEGVCQGPTVEHDMFASWSTLQNTPMRTQH